nr:spore wall protein 2-like [Ipomoea trifida]
MAGVGTVQMEVMVNHDLLTCAAHSRPCLLSSFFAVNATPLYWLQDLMRSTREAKGKGEHSMNGQPKAVDAEGDDDDENGGGGFADGEGEFSDGEAQVNNANNSNENGKSSPGIEGQSAMKL